MFVLALETFLPSYPSRRMRGEPPWLKTDAGNPLPHQATVASSEIDLGRLDLETEPGTGRSFKLVVRGNPDVAPPPCNGGIGGKSAAFAMDDGPDSSDHSRKILSVGAGGFG
jgi:hypothetical protein